MSSKNSHSGALGLDFGTSNSALAIAGPAGVRVIAADPCGDFGQTLRSVLYFDSDKHVFCGQAAIEHYLANRGEGRFMQSIKSFLADASFEETVINGTRRSLEELIAIIITRLKQSGEAALGQPVDRVVLGRPVQFSRDPRRDRLAQERLERAAVLAGFSNISFQFEPVAAAIAFEQSLAAGVERLVFIGDFGGGTSDFTIMRLRGGRLSRLDNSRDILALGGVTVAGDAFDSALMWHRVACHLGKEVRYGGLGLQHLTMPLAISGKLRRWHLIHQLREKKTRELIRTIRVHAADPRLIENLEWLVDNNLGYLLFRAIERAKIELSGEGNAELIFDELPDMIHEQLTRQEFEGYATAEVNRIGQAIDETLAAAGLAAADIDTVFTTGGTSQMPCVAGLFYLRFGINKMAQMDAFTSVAYGLGLAASEQADNH